MMDRQLDGHVMSACFRATDSADDNTLGAVALCVVRYGCIGRVNKTFKRKQKHTRDKETPHSKSCYIICSVKPKCKTSR